MSLSIPSIFGWLLNKKTARVEVNISLAFFHWVGISVHPRPFVSDITIFVLKGDVKLQLTNVLQKLGTFIPLYLWGGSIIAPSAEATNRTHCATPFKPYWLAPT